MWEVVEKVAIDRKFHQYFYKMSACRLNTRKRSRQMDRRIYIDSESVSKSLGRMESASLSSSAECYIHAHKLSTLSYHKWYMV